MKAEAKRRAELELLAPGRFPGNLKGGDPCGSRRRVCGRLHVWGEGLCAEF